MYGTGSRDIKNYDALVKKVGELNGQVKRSELRETEAQATIKALRQNLMFFENEANHGKNVQKDLKQRAIQMQDAYTKLESKLKAQTSSPRSDLAWEQQRLHIAELSEESKHWETELEKAEGEISGLKAQLSENAKKSKKRIRDLENGFNEAEREIDEQHRQQNAIIAELEANLDNTETQMAELELNLELAKDERTRLREKVAKRDAKIQELQRIIKSISSPSFKKQSSPVKLVHPKKRPEVPSLMKVKRKSEALNRGDDDDDDEIDVRPSNRRKTK